MIAPRLGDGERPLLRLGGISEVGPTVSWCPPGITGWQPINAYLITSGDAAVLVDTGVGAHVDLVLEQLRASLRPGAHLSVILTRTEMECCLNLPAIEREFVVDEVWYTGGITVPVTRASPRRLQVDSGHPIELVAAPGITVRVYSPLLRLLPVLWIGDHASGALLTSDSFCHLLTDDSGRALPPDSKGLSAFHSVKFGWIADAAATADTQAIARDVRAIVSDGWTAIGPTYGAPVVGVEQVLAQADALADHIGGVNRYAA